MRCDKQTESNAVSTLMTGRELFSGKAGHFMIVMVTAMAYFVNSRFRNLFAGTILLHSEVGAHRPHL